MVQVVTVCFVNGDRSVKADIIYEHSVMQEGFERIMNNIDRT